ncbi:MAG: hypothetical protein GVY32_08155 [Gammaproteobacteria bacterium]|jgi:hypothetical protein|nr:hypothetical protein [Gammaproteobacteria bacterium]
MRTVTLICLVLLCMAATIRVDGVWPPRAIDQRIEIALRQISDPARTVSAWLGGHGLRLLDPGASTQTGESIPAPRAAFATRRAQETDHVACS